MRPLCSQPGQGAAAPSRTGDVVGHQAVPKIWPELPRPFWSSPGWALQAVLSQAPSCSGFSLVRALVMDSSWPSGI